MANLLQRYRVTVNAAAVTLTAEIGAFMKPGSRTDVNVASLGEAKSLQGAVLLQTSLLGAELVIN